VVHIADYRAAARAAEALGTCSSAAKKLKNVVESEDEENIALREVGNV